MFDRLSLPLSALLLFFAVQPAAAQAKLHTRLTSAPTVVTVKAPIQQFLEGFVHWLHQHPAAAHLAQSPASGPPTHIGMVMLPSVDLYSPAGVSIYYTSGSKENLKFIHALPGSIRQVEREKKQKVRPTLKEAMEMIPELKPYEAAVLAKKEYAVLALTFVPPSPQCKAQDAVIRHFERRARGIGVRVIEVRLHK